MQGPTRLIRLARSSFPIWIVQSMFTNLCGRPDAAAKAAPKITAKTRPCAHVPVDPRPLAPRYAEAADNTTVVFTVCPNHLSGNGSDLESWILSIMSASTALYRGRKIACDTCRARKRRCDVWTLPHNRKTRGADSQCTIRAACHLALCVTKHNFTAFMRFAAHTL